VALCEHTEKGACAALKEGSGIAAPTVKHYICIKKIKEACLTPLLSFGRPWCLCGMFVQKSSKHLSQFVGILILGGVKSNFFSLISFSLSLTVVFL
jgi:hypothetical protein